MASQFHLFPDARWRVGLALSVSAGLFWNCAASSGDSDLDGGVGTDAGVDVGDSSIIDLGPQGGAGGASASHLSALCGQGDCIPDGGESCAAGGAGYGGMGGAGPTACRLDVTCVGVACQGQRTCGTVGVGERGAPCFDSADCSAGLGCVGDTDTGSCQPICCSGTVATCGSDEFCGARPLVGVQGALVPVCVPTENCPLSDPFPCPEGRSCACTGDRACVVVRADGQTACAVPGKGTTGAPCNGNEPGECAHGYVCSSAAGCIQLCSPLASDNGCQDGQTCQTPADFPVDLGVCVDDTAGNQVAK